MDKNSFFNLIPHLVLYNIMRYKRILRLILLAFIIALASILPVPLTFKSKDNLPKNFIEQIETKKEDEDDDCKALF